MNGFLHVSCAQKKQGQSLKFSYIQKKTWIHTLGRFLRTSKVPWEMNLNVNIHRKTYFNIYQNENGNLSSNEIERTVKNEIIEQKKKFFSRVTYTNSLREFNFFAWTGDFFPLCWLWAAQKVIFVLSHRSIWPSPLLYPFYLLTLDFTAVYNQKLCSNPKQNQKKTIQTVSSKVSNSGNKANIFNKKTYSLKKTRLQNCLLISVSNVMWLRNIVIASNNNVIFFFEKIPNG